MYKVQKVLDSGFYSAEIVHGWDTIVGICSLLWDSETTAGADDQYGTWTARVADTVLEYSLATQLLNTFVLLYHNSTVLLNFLTKHPICLYPSLGWSCTIIADIWRLEASDSDMKCSAFRDNDKIRGVANHKRGSWSALKSSSVFLSNFFSFFFFWKLLRDTARLKMSLMQR